MYTTYNARTYLQPQLNKAVRMTERAYSPLTDRNPKDHILFQTSSCTSDQVGREMQRTGFSAKTVSRDNTGTGTFLPRTPFPTMNFPSDHAIVCAELQLEHHESFRKIEYKLCKSAFHHLYFLTVVGFELKPVIIHHFLQVCRLFEDVSATHGSVNCYQAWHTT